MSKQRNWILAVVVTVWACTPLTVMACVCCVTPNGGLKLNHPKSLVIAMAIRRDLDLGLLTNPAQEESKDQRPSRDSQMWGKLAGRKFLADGFEVLLIEDGKLHRVDALDELSSTTRQIRLITGRSVLEGLLDRRLHLETAINRGLVIVETASTVTKRKTDRATTGSK